MVACDLHSECILKADDEEASLVLFAGNAGMQSIGNEVMDVVVHGADMSRRCEVAGGVSVRAKVANEAPGEERPLCHKCILCRVHEPSMCFTC